MSQTVMSFLRRVIPFRFLSLERKQWLVQRLVRVEYQVGDIIIQQGDPKDDYVYLIESGSVDVRDPQRKFVARLSAIYEGHYFGEWEPLFCIPRRLQISAREKVVCWRMEGGVFLQLLQDSAEFALAFGTTLRDKQGIFAAFDRFRSELLRAVGSGTISITDLLPFYRALQPTIHTAVGREDVIDVDGLVYAVRRLPENITRTFAFLLTDELPPSYHCPDCFFPPVSTDARRRDVWEILPGKNLVLLRNGMSDLTDLLTCLCLYAVEAGKIQARLDHQDILSSLDAFVKNPQPDFHAFLSTLPFSEEEIIGVQQIWPKNTIQRIYELVRHRGMFNLEIQRQTDSWNSRRTDLWTGHVGQAMRDSIGFDPSELPADRKLHIISSNTHSVSNCLNPWYAANIDEILVWAEKIGHVAVQETWETRFDMLYAVVRDYFRQYPEQQKAALAEGRRHGIITLEETASTGIQVQLIDCSLLSKTPGDPGVAPVPAGNNDIIVNIDYAFGQQAEHIMRNLLMLFGGNVASINFFGKAGALRGERGDVLVPTAFIEQTSDIFQPLPGVSARAMADLQERLPNRGLHVGPMLTVEGTLLQNSMMLHFYRQLWNCAGLEMEGTHYFRQVLEAQQIGVVPADIDLRFFYYVSDLPLSPKSSLSSPMAVVEGVPPLYAITRHILSGIFCCEY